MTEQHPQYDIAVIGAGPAGTTFARLAVASGASILLIDGQTEGRAKPCGGLLAPDAQRVLAEFGLTLPKEILVDPQIFSVKTIDVRQKRIRYYPRFYLNLDRFRFDRWLLSLVPSSVTVRQGRCRSVGRDGDRFLLKVGEESFSAKAVVGADGADSIVRRTFYPDRKIMKYTAIQQWFRSDDLGEPFYSCIFDPETSESCSWSIGKDGSFLFGGAFRPEGCREAFEKQKKRVFSLLDIQPGEPLRTEACLVCRPRRPSDFVTGKDGVFLIGEAAGFISPSSFEGISSALLCGKALAEALGTSDPARSYRRATAPLRRKLLLKCIKRPFMYQPTLRRLVMKSGLTAIDVTEIPHTSVRKQEAKQNDRETVS